ncbi:LAETG motif-containing sortase-dependent surface protein [Streptomyces syringium]|uniref:LAETG motif-containing sortase-dependent surface protein n=1 Tax=Streptomyces syringium TaxID=76729 RepID=UPI00339F0D43
MKLSRITAAVAAASIAPAVFLATPAVADGTDVKPPVTAGAEEEPGSAGGEKSSAEESNTTQAGRPVDVINFPEKLTAGGDWAEFSFVLDNKDAEDLKNFSLSFWLNSGTERPGKLDQEDPRATKLKYRTRIGSTTSDWQSMVDTVTGSTVRGEKQFGAIPKGTKLTVDLRIRLGDAFPAGQATTIVNTPTGVEAPSLRDITVTAKDDGKTTPTESTSPTAKSTATGGTDTKQPTGKATTSASATPTTTATASPSATPTTATPSATASSTWAAAGTTTTGGTGELAKTGADSTTPWAVAGSAAALALGASLVVTARRRRGSHEA